MSNNHKRNGKFKRGNAAAVKVAGGFDDELRLRATSGQVENWHLAATVDTGFRQQHILATGRPPTFADWARDCLTRAALAVIRGTSQKPGPGPAVPAGSWPIAAPPPGPAALGDTRA